jgi:hypothetical protein
LAIEPTRKEELMFELSFLYPMKFVGVLLKLTLVPADDRGVLANYLGNNISGTMGALRAV